MTQKNNLKKWLQALAVILVLPLTASCRDKTVADDFTAIYKKASPAVVNITTTIIKRDFFMNPVPSEGAGSGIIIDKKGYILTNNHVVKNKSSAEVTLFDGSRWPGKVMGRDPDNDLAVIHIEAPPKKLTTLAFGKSSQLQVGQKVLAIGNPFGLSETLTTGIVSSLGRSLKSANGTIMEDLIQTDAAINPGNSGGPLLDTGGRVIGINNAIISPSGGNIGIGFAIPSDTAVRVIPELISKGYVSYPWLGVTLYPLRPAMAEQLGLVETEGAMIIEIVPDGPADLGGLKQGDEILRSGNVIIPVGGDIITGCDNRPVKKPADLIRYIRTRSPGDIVKLSILRENRFKTVKIKLGEKPLKK